MLAPLGTEYPSTPYVPSLSLLTYGGLTVVFPGNFWGYVGTLRYRIPVYPLCTQSVFTHLWWPHIVFPGYLWCYVGTLRYRIPLYPLCTKPPFTHLWWPHNSFPWLPLVLCWHPKVQNTPLPPMYQAPLYSPMVASQ